MSIKFLKVLDLLIDILEEAVIEDEQKANLQNIKMEIRLLLVPNDYAEAANCSKK